MLKRLYVFLWCRVLGWHRWWHLPIDLGDGRQKHFTICQRCNRQKPAFIEPVPARES